MGNEALIEAIRFFDSQQKLSKVLGVNRKVINNWLNMSVRVPVQHAMSIEILTDGKVRAEKLSPHARAQIMKYKTFLKGK
ncbi:MAG: Cro/CI family transcriptional regulator [Gammaproteobacteria bacterium]|nr:Cro/CI family transcriptional regulator [Gammaproteobacteria bacterium]